jgi:predicted lipid-binding transport protein (Tim44 family)
MGMIPTSRVLVLLVTVLMLVGAAGEVWARAGGGGSRGSRSYSSPARPAPMSPSSPSTPSRSLNAPAPAPAPRPSPFGGFMGALGGFMLGGLLGSLLFGGLGSGLGIGLMDLLLIGGGLFLLFRLMRSRRQEPAYAGVPGGSAYAGVPGGSAYAGGDQRSWSAPAGAATVDERAPVPDDLERGLGHVRQMDPGFDAAALASDAADTFRAVQTAMSAGDLVTVRSRLAPDMLAHLEAQCTTLRRSGHRNHIERIQIERTEVTEAWQERGQDFVTVLLAGSLIDYTVDGSGAVIAGSRTGPERFEEFWTFSRPVGPNAWKLTAIQSA